MSEQEAMERAWQLRGIGPDEPDSPWAVGEALKEEFRAGWSARREWAAARVPSPEPDWKAKYEHLAERYERNKAACCRVRGQMAQDALSRPCPECAARVPSPEAAAPVSLPDERKD